MLSTLVLMPPFGGDTLLDSSALVRSLAALVPGAVDGLVRDVTVMAAQPDDSMREVAEHAGCRIVVEGTFDTALRSAESGARSAVFFLLRAGASFDRSFLDEVAGYFNMPPADPSRVLLLREAPTGLVSRVLPDLAPVAGLIAPRAALARAGRNFEALVRLMRTTQTLTARAQMAS